MSEDVHTFFEALAERAYKENDLSDVTYALCQSSQIFKQFFLDFFFGSDVIDASKADIEREHSFKQGRPDFLINTHNEMFLLEAKIWDGNHHFDQYSSILMEETRKPVGHLAYIANYEIKYDNLPHKDQAVYKNICCEKKSVKTWKEFIGRLEKYECFNDSLIQGYVSYVKKVCPFDNFTVNIQSEINICVFKEIKNIYGWITQAIKNADRMSLYTRSSKYFVSQSRIGRFFEWEIEKKKVWGWYGILYRDSDAVLAIEFENRIGWGDLICDRCKDKLSLENNCLRFYFCEKDITEDTIRNFLQQVLGAIRNNTVSKYTFADKHDDKRIVPFTNLLIMKQLPYLLENFFYKMDLSELNYKIVPEYKKDQEVPDSHCGRYFKLIKNSDNDDAHNEIFNNPVIGWIGAIYNNKSIKNNSPDHDFSKNPKFILEISHDWAEARIKQDSTWGNEWYSDEWGWKCYDIPGNINSFERLLEKVKKIFEKLLKANIAQ